MGLARFARSSGLANLFLQPKEATVTATLMPRLALIPGIKYLLEIPNKCIVGSHAAVKNCGRQFWW